MTRYKVTAPEPNYVGSIGAVQFEDGAAVIDEDIHPGVLAYCRGAGYRVEAEQPEAADPEVPFDPSSNGVPTVLAYLADADVDEATRVLDAEAAGKNRKGITDQRDAILESKKESDK